MLRLVASLLVGHDPLNAQRAIFILKANFINYNSDKEDQRRGGKDIVDWGRIINATSGIALLRKKVLFADGVGEKFVENLKAVVPASVLF